MIEVEETNAAITLLPSVLNGDVVPKDLTNRSRSSAFSFA